MGDVTMKPATGVCLRHDQVYRGECLQCVCDERDQLKAQNDRFADRINRMDDELDEWQSAAGINKGSDPSGLEPLDLSKYIGRVDKIVHELSALYRININDSFRGVQVEQLIRDACLVIVDYPDRS